MAVVPTPIFEAFSVTHAQILDGSTTFEAAAAAVASVADDIYGVSDASITPNSNSFANQGDNATLSRWYWLEDAEIAVKSGFISFPLLANLTGRPISSSGSGANVIFGMDLWHEDSFNIGRKPMLIQMPSRDSDGNVRQALIGLYGVDFAPLMFDGPVIYDGLKANYNGTAVGSKKDEVGAAFSDGKKRFGKLLSIGPPS